MVVKHEFDTFPDGVYEAPLVSEAHDEQLGTAVVTFTGGLWTAHITIDNEVAEELGLDLSAVTKLHPNKEPKVVLVLKDAEWG